MKEKKPISLEQFVMNIRWAVGVLTPLIFLVSDKPVDVFLILLIVVYNTGNLLQQIALLKGIDIKKYQLFILIFDLIIVSVTIYNRGGFRSDVFQGYYVFIMISAILYGIKTTLFVSCLSAVVYSIIGFLQIGPELSFETVIHRTLSRGFIFIILGILTSYLSVRYQKQQESILFLEYERSRLQKEAEESQRKANLDGLTELYNHRYFHERLAEEIRRAGENGWNLSLLMLDIDRFKQINDTYGHIKGDFILKETAKILNNLVRKHDVVARYGGEEFAVILIECDSTLAKAIAERIRRSIAEYDFEGVRVTVSIGIATLASGCSATKDLINMADKALYEAKRERNKTCVA